MAALLTILTEALLRAFYRGELTPEQSEEVAEAIKEDEEAQAFLDRLKGPEPGSTETTGDESSKGPGTNDPDTADKKRKPS